MTQAQERPGVLILHPASVYIDPDVPADAIAPGVTIYPGCRLMGKQTSIGPGSCIGREGPVTLENTSVGYDARLGGGYFSGSVLLDKVTFGADAHVRPGCLIEEGVTCGHAVGLKQSLLMPFAALGSLINFCDILLTGGTGSSNHSEVGSSYVHFNFTPRGDKATPSLFGNVPQGVMLNQPPIFLGGQGGIVGPARVAFGTVAAAGTILRGDQLERAHLVSGPSPAALQPFDPARTGNPVRKLLNNVIYVANLQALHHWYRFVRRPFAAPDRYRRAGVEGGLAVLESMIAERLIRLEQWFGILQEDHVTIIPSDFARLREALSLSANENAARDLREAFLTHLPPAAAPATDYPGWIRRWDAATRQAGVAWLQATVDFVLTSCRLTPA